MYILGAGLRPLAWRSRTGAIWWQHLCWIDLCLPQTSKLAGVSFDLLKLHLQQSLAPLMCFFFCTNPHSIVHLPSHLSTVLLHQRFVCWKGTVCGGNTHNHTYMCTYNIRNMYDVTQSQSNIQTEFSIFRTWPKGVNMTWALCGLTLLCYTLLSSQLNYFIGQDSCSLTFLNQTGFCFACRNREYGSGM